MDNILQDSQSIISDITENNDNNTTISFEIEIKVNEITVKLNSELNKLNLDSLKDKAKDLGVSGISKIKKPDLIQILENEFIKLLPILKEKKSNDLKNICKQCGIKGVAGCKKDYLVCQILEYHSSILKFKLDDIQVQQEEKEKEREPDIKIEQLSLIEQLEKQKQEIELKMREETKRQKEEEDKRQKEKEREEEERRQKEKEKEEETKRQKEKEKEKEKEKDKEKEKEKDKEDKKKKQSIPKNVRVIIWNHYIGEDIIKHKCLCCKKVTISNTNFDVGHVLSEKNGGTHEINNLRPICFACNHSMGSENMIDFVVKFGLFIG
jgi:5-methylcytosine-specific restriction endonuclease McrA